MDSYNQIKVTVPVCDLQLTSDVMTMMKEAGYREVTGCKDLAGLDRVVYGTYQE